MQAEVVFHLLRILHKNRKYLNVRRVRFAPRLQRSQVVKIAQAKAASMDWRGSNRKAKPEQTAGTAHLPTLGASNISANFCCMKFVCDEILLWLRGSQGFKTSAHIALESLTKSPTPSALLFYLTLDSVKITESQDEALHLCVLSFRTGHGLAQRLAIRHDGGA